MLALSLFVLCLAAPQAAAVQAGASVAPSTSAAELRPIAWRDEPRSRALALPVAISTTHLSELREPFATTPKTTTKPAPAPAALREPFSHPRPVTPATPTATDGARSNLREPFSRR